MTFLARTKELLASPVVALLVGVLCTLCSLRLTQAHVEPVYLADSEPINQPRIRSNPRSDWMFGDDGRKAAHAGTIPHRATCLARVAFWNHGNEIITPDRFTAADPLRIIATQPIELYQLDIIHKSRSTLRFRVTPTTRALLLTVADRDAIDPLDGVVFRLLYTGDCDTGFAIQGRIIGANRIPFRGESTPDFKGWYALPVLIPIFLLITAVKGGVQARARIRTSLHGCHGDHHVAAVRFHRMELQSVPGTHMATIDLDPPTKRRSTVQSLWNAQRPEHSQCECWSQ